MISDSGLLIFTAMTINTAVPPAPPTRSFPPQGLDFKELDLNQLHVSASWQKERYDQRFATQLANELKLELVGVLSVAVDSAGQYQIWDGQHRHYALQKNGYSRWMCAVVHADTREQAEMFVHQADRKGLTGSSKHSAAVHWNSTARDIDGIVRNHGYILSPGKPNSIRAVTGIYHIYNRAGADVLDRTIGISKGAWPLNKAGRSDIVLDGIATFIQAFDGRFVDVDVAACLAAHGDPEGFAAAAVRMCPKLKVGRETRQAKKFESFALYLAKEYGRANNLKLHSKHVAEVNRKTAPRKSLV